MEWIVCNICNGLYKLEPNASALFCLCNAGISTVVFKLVESLIQENIYANQENIAVNNIACWES